MGKMKRVYEDDDTSKLPGDILNRILSLLPTGDIVRASCVSKRWKSLCPPLSVLDLDFESFSKNSSLNHKEKKEFYDFVQAMILLHKDKRLKKIRLEIDISEFEQDRALIDKWASFAMSNDSGFLDLDFHGGKVDRMLEIYRPWPVCPVRLQSLKVLRLKHCCISLPPSDMSFSLLKTVVLTMVDCLNQSVYDFINNCPCLEQLYLIKCILPEDIRFEDPESTLKCLVIDSCETTHGFTHYIRIDIPSLLRFKFAGELLVHSYVVKPRNLIETELDIREVYFYADNADQVTGPYELLRNLLTNMDNVNTLTLSSSCIQVLIDDEDIAMDVLVQGYESHAILPPPLPNLKHLTVKMSAGQEAVNILCLLRSCPNLETLSVDFSCKFLKDKDFSYMSSANYDDDDDDDDDDDEDNDTEENFWRLELLPSKFLRHVKKVEIKGFEGRNVENIFIKCMLANSLVLEKMVIYKSAMKSRYVSVKRDGNKKELKLLMAEQRKAIEYLLTFRRGSTRAQVLLLED